MCLLRILYDEIVGNRQLCSSGRSTTTARARKKKDETKLIEFFINPFQANIPILYPP